MTPAARLMQGRGALPPAVLQGLATLPPLALLLWQDGGAMLRPLASAALIVLVWDIAFATARRRPLEPVGLTTALIVAVMVPADLPLWHLAVALSLGYVVGERVFGGRGFAFLSPAAVTLALLLLSLPTLELRAPDAALALACLPGALLLVAAGLLSLRVLLGFGIVLIVLTGATDLQGLATLATASAVAALFLIGDPTTGAVTRVGQVAHGGLAGLLAWVFAGSGSTPPGAEALVFAALLASIFAPLLDHLAILAGRLYRGQRRA